MKLKPAAGFAGRRNLDLPGPFSPGTRVAIALELTGNYIF